MQGAVEDSGAGAADLFHAILRDDQLLPLDFLQKQPAAIPPEPLLPGMYTPPISPIPNAVGDGNALSDDLLLALQQLALKQDTMQQVRREGSLLLTAGTDAQLR